MTTSKSENEVFEILEREQNSFVAIHSTDNQGNNESFDTAEISKILETLPNYNFNRCVIADPNTVDIDVWAQEFDDEIKSNLQNDLTSGRLYVASFTSDDLGNIDLLLWD